jgi:hypothetical protein
VLYKVAEHPNTTHRCTYLLARGVGQLTFQQKLDFNVSSSAEIGSNHMVMRFKFDEKT